MSSSRASKDQKAAENLFLAQGQDRQDKASAEATPDQAWQGAKHHELGQEADGHSSKKAERYLATVWRRFRHHRLGMLSLWVFVFLLIVALAAPFFTADPAAISGQFNAAPSAQHWLGTDQSSRDVFSRLLSGLRISLLVGVLVTAISTVIGVILGLLSGFFGGLVDAVIMRLTDVVMSFPYLLLVLVAAAVFRPGLWNIILILGFVNWPSLTRLVRGNVLALREASFVAGSKIAGLPRRHILFSEILPNTIAPVLIYASSVLSLSILDEAALSFLGQGVQAPMASLGNMLGGAESLTVLTTKPWIWLPPGILIILVVVSINFIGDALRDALDPSRTQQGGGEG